MTRKRQGRVTNVEAYRTALTSLMRDDERIVVVGEDVRSGGAFQTSVGLLEGFGPRRIVDAPISEAAILGLAIGSALRGLRPVVDFQYGDFLFAATDQLVQHATKLPEMSGGRLQVPLVLQLPTGASGRGAQHAHSIEAAFFGTPGLEIATPSTPADVAGLLRTALTREGVVLFCLHKHLYGAEGRRLHHPDTSTGPLPDEGHSVPFGSAAVRRPGRDITMVANLLMAHRALAAAVMLEDEGIAAEVIDVRTIVPLDVATVRRSVERTRRLIVIEEGPRRAGWGAYLVAELLELGPSMGSA